MAVSFPDLQLAFEFVSSGGMGENEAYLDRRSGKIYWHSEFGELKQATLFYQMKQKQSQNSQIIARQLSRSRHEYWV
jgi:hypothetical protein